MAPSKKILYVQYANPGAFPPIEYSAHILAERGWEVLLLGAQSLGAEALVLSSHALIRSEIEPYVAPGWRQKVAYLRFVRRALRLAFSWKPDWVYVSDPLGAPPGLLLARLLGCKVVYHEHDSPTRTLHATSFMRAVLASRTQLARIAEFNVIPQPERLRVFVEDTGTTQPIHCVMNCPRARDVVPGASRTRTPDQPLSLYFHGSINLERVPLTLFEGAALCEFAVRIRIVGYETIGSVGACDQLRAAAARAGPNVILELPGPVPRGDLMRCMDGMHVGWMNFLDRSNHLDMKYFAGASNKAFDYLAGGIPMIVPDSTDWRRFVDAGYARACDATDPQDIARVLRWFHDNPAAAADMGARGQGKITADWNYETQFGSVLAQLE